MDYLFNFERAWVHWPDFLWGAWLTLRLSTLSMLLGLALGIVLALVERSNFRAIRWPVIAYGEVIRNTPFLVQVFIIFFGLPSLGVRLSPNTAALLALVINTAAYCAEIVRAGVESVSRGQIEAGRALGLRAGHIFRFIVFPPAIIAVYPALTSQFMMLLVSSSVVSVISAEELTSISDNLSSTTFLTMEIYLIATGIYLIMSVMLASLFRAVGQFLLPGQKTLRRIGA